MYHKLKVSILTCSIIILIIWSMIMFKNAKKLDSPPTLALKSNFVSNPTLPLDTRNIPSIMIPEINAESKSIVARLPQLPVTQNQFAELFQYFIDPNLLTFPHFINDEKYINQINLLKNNFLKYFNDWNQMIEQCQKDIDDTNNKLDSLKRQKKINESTKRTLTQQRDAIKKQLNTKNNKTELTNRINEIEHDIEIINHHNKIQDISIDTLQSNYNDYKKQHDNALKSKNDLLLTAELQLKSILEIKNIINQNKNYSEQTLAFKP